LTGGGAGPNIYTGHVLDLSEWDMERFFVLHAVNESIGVHGRDARHLREYQEFILISCGPTGREL
jgi:hypothetical protein